MPKHLLFALSLFIPACGQDTAPSPADDGSEDDDTVLDAGAADAGKRDASPPKRDAKVMDATIRPVPEKDCTPGIYDGDFSCVISMFLPWAGKLHFELVQQSMNLGEFQILSVVPGTKITGNDDNLQGMFTAELQGDFDCSTGQFTGQIANGIYMFGPMPFHLAGPLQGTYRSDGGSGFDGTMGPLTSSDFDIYGALAPSATCTWQASYNGAADDSRDE